MFYPDSVAHGAERGPGLLLGGGMTLKDDSQSRCRRNARPLLLSVAAAVTALAAPPSSEAASRNCGHVPFNGTTQTEVRAYYGAPCSTARTLAKRADRYQRKNPRAVSYADQTGWRCQLPKQRGKSVQRAVCRPKNKRQRPRVVVKDVSPDPADELAMNTAEVPFSLGSAVNWWGRRLCVLARHGSEAANAKLYVARREYDYYKTKLEEAQWAAGIMVGVPSWEEQEQCPEADATANSDLYPFRYGFPMGSDGSLAANIARGDDSWGSFGGRAVYTELKAAYNYVRDRIPEQARAAAPTFERLQAAMKVPAVEEIPEP